MKAYKRFIIVLSTFYTLRKQIINIYKDAPKIIVEHFFPRLCLQISFRLILQIWWKKIWIYIYMYIKYI